MSDRIEVAVEGGSRVKFNQHVDVAGDRVTSLVHPGPAVYWLGVTAIKTEGWSAGPREIRARSSAVAERVPQHWDLVRHRALGADVRSRQAL